MGRCTKLVGVFVLLVAVFIGTLVSGAAGKLGLFRFISYLYPEAIGLSSAFVDPEQLEKFDGKNLPNLSGKIAVVTGANRGLGLSTARFLAEKGCKVILACRDSAACDSAAAKSRGLGVARLVDLSSLASVKTFAENILKEFHRLDILVLNAGIAMVPFSLTEDGLERTFAVNHIANHLLVRTLRPLLETTAVSHPVTIVSVSSASHFDQYKPEGIRLNLADLNSETKFVSHLAYGQSKLANVLFAQELAEQFKSSNIIVTSCHPGMVATEILAHVPAEVGKFCGSTFGPFASTVVAKILAVGKPLMWTEDQGALTQTWLAASPPKDASGKYFHPMVQLVEPHPHAAPSSSLRQQLWQFTEDILKSKGF